MAKPIFIKELEAFQGRKCAACDAELAHHERLYLYDEDGRKFYYCGGCHQKTEAPGNR